MRAAETHWGATTAPATPGSLATAATALTSTSAHNNPTIASSPLDAPTLSETTRVYAHPVLSAMADLWAADAAT